MHATVLLAVKYLAELNKYILLARVICEKYRFMKDSSIGTVLSCNISKSNSTIDNSVNRKKVTGKEVAGKKVTIIHYLKTFQVGRMMNGPCNLVTTG